MTKGYTHPDVDVEVYLDGKTRGVILTKLRVLCRKRGWPREGWEEIKEEA